jgi:Flp pilus assembly protein TadB
VTAGAWLAGGALTLAAIVVACAGRTGRDTGRRRLASAVGLRPATTAVADAPARRRPPGRPVVGIGAGVCAGLLAGGWWTVPVALGVGALAVWWLARQQPASVRAERRQVTADLPYAADLLAAALRAGARPDSAAEAVGAAVGGPLGERLRRVSHALRLGAPAAEAWACLGDTPGGGAVARAAARSEHSGAACAEALRRQADDLRSERLTASDAAGRRAAVLVVLPLGLCFLPAFVLAGLVPVIVAVLGDVLPP